MPGCPVPFGLLTSEARGDVGAFPPIERDDGSAHVQVFGNANTTPPRPRWWTSRPRKTGTLVTTTATRMRTARTTVHPRSHEPGVFPFYGQTRAGLRWGTRRCRQCETSVAGLGVAANSHSCNWRVRTSRRTSGCGCFGCRRLERPHDDEPGVAGLGVDTQARSQTPVSGLSNANPRSGPRHRSARFPTPLPGLRPEVVALRAVSARRGCARGCGRRLGRWPTISAFATRIC